MIEMTKEQKGLYEELCSAPKLAEIKEQWRGNIDLYIDQNAYERISEVGVHENFFNNAYIDNVQFNGRAIPAKVEGAYFGNCLFLGMSASDISWKNVDIRDGFFADVKFNQCDFEKSFFEHCQFKGCSIQNSNFMEAIMQGGSFTNSEINGCNMFMNIRGTEFYSCRGKDNMNLQCAEFKLPAATAEERGRYQERVLSALGAGNKKLDPIKPPSISSVPKL